MGDGGHRKLSLALVVAGTIVTLLAIFSIWANRQLLNTDNWVSTSDRLLTNERVDERLADYLAEEVFTGERREAKLEEARPPKLAPLAGAVAGGLHGLAPQVAERLLEAPKVQGLWSDANRHAHEELLRVLDGGGTTVTTANGTVTLDLKPIVETLCKRDGAAHLREQLPVGAGGGRPEANGRNARQTGRRGRTRRTAAGGRGAADTISEPRPVEAMA